MKQIVTIFFSGVIALHANAQTKAKPKSAAPVKKITTVAAGKPVQLKNLTDSASYAIGQNLAASISKDLKSLNKDAFLEAIKEVFQNKPTRFSEEQSRTILTAFQQVEMENQSKVFVDAEKAFFAKLKSNSNIKTTATGLQYEAIKEGTGEKPGPNDTVVCNYRGSLTDSTEFDNSYERGEPLTIQVSSVIPGWTEGLQLMRKGARYKFYIPFELGYGLRGAPPTIPAGSTLIFDVELIDVKKGE